MLVYLQSFLLVYLAIMFLVVPVVVGTGTGFTLEGALITQQWVITEKAAIGLLVLHSALALVLVLLAAESARGGELSRWGLTVVEAAVAVYTIAFLSTAVSTWVEGPVLCAAVVLCHWWDVLTGHAAPAAESTGATTVAPIPDAATSADAAAEPAPDATAPADAPTAEPAATTAAAPRPPRRRATSAQSGSASTSTTTTTKRKRAPRKPAAGGAAAADTDGSTADRPG